jgi:hypothetical protein
MYGVMMSWWGSVNTGCRRLQGFESWFRYSTDSGKQFTDLLGRKIAVDSLYESSFLFYFFIFSWMLLM